MDNIDKKLLSILQQNARMPLNHLAQQVFLSSPAVAARIEKLENSEIIKGYKAIINLQKLGLYFMAFIEVMLSPEQKPEFIKLVESCPNVLECYAVAGAYSMILKVCFPTPDKLNIFVNQLQAFGKTQTQIILSSIIESKNIEP